MKTIKTKLIAIIGGVGALCVLCCTLPIMAFLGLGSLEAFFCENKFIQGAGIFLIGGATFLLARKIFQNINLVNSCAVDCGCKSSKSE